MENKKLKIAVVAHGRFHAFDLVRALIQRGNDVTLFTNYPKWAVEKFGIHRQNVKSFWMHGILSRVLELFHKKMKFPFPEAWLHQMFGRWAAQQINRETWDVVHAWSGVCEETQKYSRSMDNPRLKLLMRGSSHIRTQAKILEEEERRIGLSIERPSPWIVAREEREYALVDHIIVLSEFARKSFLDQGISSDKLINLPLGVSIQSFRATLESIKERQKRILSSKTLRVLYVGAVSFRKGLWDLIKTTKLLDPADFDFRLVGPVSKEVKGFLRQFPSNVEIISKQPQKKLPQWYSWGDVFVFPTLEDGYAVVLSQAAGPQRRRDQC